MKRLILPFIVFCLFGCGKASEKQIKEHNDIINFWRHKYDDATAIVYKRKCMPSRWNEIKECSTSNNYRYCCRYKQLNTQMQIEFERWRIMNRMKSNKKPKPSNKTTVQKPIKTEEPFKYSNSTKI